jgi:hypothetical protein
MFSITKLRAASAHSRAVSTGKLRRRIRLDGVWDYMPGLRTPSRHMKNAVEGTENQAVDRASFSNAPGLINCFLSWATQDLQFPTRTCHGLTNQMSSV